LQRGFADGILQDRNNFFQLAAVSPLPAEGLSVTKNLQANEAYCSWTGVYEAHRGKGVALQLKLAIFEEDNITSFSGDIKQNNTENLRVLEKFDKTQFDFTNNLNAKGTHYNYKVSKLNGISDAI
jgi:hypothetical protein